MAPGAAVGSLLQRMCVVLAMLVCKTDFPLSSVCIRMKVGWDIPDEPSGVQCYAQVSL